MGNRRSKKGLTALALAVACGGAACTTAGGGDGDGGSALPSMQGEGLPADESARASLDELRARFAPGVSRERDPVAADAEVALPGAPRPPDLQTRVAPFSRGAIASLAPAAQGRDALRAKLDPMRAGPGYEADVVVASRFEDGFEIGADHAGLRVRVTPRGAADDGLADARAELVDGLLVHRSPRTGRIVSALRLERQGVEDYRVVESSATRSLAYDVDLENVASLALYHDSLELLDERGAPSLRVPPPMLVDAAGAVREAHLAVEGCAVDPSARMTWGTPLVAPGARSCVVRVSWDDDGLTYPLAIDPAWTTTGNTMFSRRRHAMVTLKSGVVLSLGGQSFVQNDEVEAWDPAEPVPSWKRLEDLTFGREGFAAYLDAEGDVVAIGGAQPIEFYRLATGKWELGPSMPANSVHGPSAQLADGRIIYGQGFVLGGVDPRQTPLFDPDAGPVGTWAPAVAGNCSVSICTVKARCYGSMVALPDNRVVQLPGSCGSEKDITAGSEIFTPTATGGSWSELGDAMIDRRYSTPAVRLPDGRIVVAGGRNSDAITVDTIEALTLSPLAWTTLPGKMVRSRQDHAAALLPASGGLKLLVLAGLPFKENPTNTTEVYDFTLGAWLPSGLLPAPQQATKATTLLDGSIMTANGAFGGGAQIASARFRQLDDGAACNARGECRSGHCVDGVCCESACDAGLCTACSKAIKGTGNDGECEAIDAGIDPQDECTDDGAATCASGGKNGFCDGAGACQKYDPTICVAPPCESDDECSTGHCVEGVCCDTACDGVCEACTAANKTSGNDGTCGPVKSGLDPRGSCDDSGSPTCQDDGFCDGAGACRKYAPGACQPAACTSGDECASGFCVEGICCDAACDADCESCRKALRDPTGKNASIVDGQCGPIAGGTDPKDKCEVGAGFPKSCAADGACDGTTNQCRVFALVNTPCGETACEGPTSIAGYICNGAGQCIPDIGFCGAFTCDVATGACRTTCASNDECSGEAFCDAGTCVGLLKSGSSCEKGPACESGFCVDGVCCSSACSGQCEACDLEGKEGQCSPVAGAPVGGRKPCDGEGTECGGECDGVAIATCAYPKETKRYAPTTCEGAKLTQYFCDGAGAEQNEGQGEATDCTPYACADATSCGTVCGADDECASGYTCSGGACIPGARCTPDNAAVVLGQKETSCAPYRCVDGACKERCSSTVDCAAEYVCSEAGACEQPSSEVAAEDGGCGCEVPGRGSRTRGVGSAWAALVALVALVRSRRRRRSCVAHP